MAANTNRFTILNDEDAEANMSAYAINDTAINASKKIRRHTINSSKPIAPTQSVVQPTQQQPIRPSNNRTVENKLQMIQLYFGVSYICAVYLYYRRRRGCPWKQPGDPKYLEWTIKLQNAIIHLDMIPNFNWESLEFGYEELSFIKNNINIQDMSDEPVVKAATESDDGFTINYSKADITKELNKMGLLPRKYT